MTSERPLTAHTFHLNVPSTWKCLTHWIKCICTRHYCRDHTDITKDQSCQSRLLTYRHKIKKFKIKMKRNNQFKNKNLKLKSEWNNQPAITGWCKTIHTALAQLAGEYDGLTFSWACISLTLVCYGVMDWNAASTIWPNVCYSFNPKYDQMCAILSTLNVGYSHITVLWCANLASSPSQLLLDDSPAINE